MLTWMKQHETRFQIHHRSSTSTEKLQRNIHDPSKKNQKRRITTDAKTSLCHVLETSNNSQRTMDAFLPVTPKSDLFDDEFQLADFQLITKRWKEKNQIGLAVN